MRCSPAASIACEGNGFFPATLLFLLTCCPPGRHHYSPSFVMAYAIFLPLLWSRRSISPMLKLLPSPHTHTMMMLCVSTLQLY